MIYKILRLPEWEAALPENVFLGSADDLRDGFIHFSTREQVAGTVGKYFSDETELIIVSVNEMDLAEALKWEASRNGALFPHLYAELPLGLVSDALFVHREAGTPFVWPDDPLEGGTEGLLPG